MTHVALEAAATLEKEGSPPRWWTCAACARSTRTPSSRASSETHRLRRGARRMALRRRRRRNCRSRAAPRVRRARRPILRVTTLDVPMPYSAKLEQRVHAPAGARRVDRDCARSDAAVADRCQEERDGEDPRDAEAVAHDGRGRPLGVAQEGGRRDRGRRPPRRGRDRQGHDGVSRRSTRDAARRSSSRRARR